MFMNAGFQQLFYFIAGQSTLKLFKSTPDIEATVVTKNSNVTGKEDSVNITTASNLVSLLRISVMQLHPYTKIDD